MKIVKKDLVKILIGKDKGREGEVIRAIPSKMQVVVKGLNIFNTKYLLANSGSGSSITTTINTSAPGGGIPTYYVSAPRFVSMTFSSDF